jgi:hypothetical protein
LQQVGGQCHGRHRIFGSAVMKKSSRAGLKSRHGAALCTRTAGTGVTRPERTVDLFAASYALRAARICLQAGIGVPGPKMPLTPAA